MHSFTRKVVGGHKVARGLGFPTINFRTARISFKKGVYACVCRVAGKRYQAVAYFGPKLASRELTLECHIFDRRFPAQKLYHQQVRVDILEFVRKPMRFASGAEAQKQITQDISQVQNYFQTHA